MTYEQVSNFIFYIFLSILFSGSAGSSIKSSSSPNGEDSRPTSSRPASGQSFIRHSIDRSFGQSILKKANNQSVKSVRTQDLVDRDEDAETTYSRQSIRLLESPRLILSQDHGRRKVHRHILVIWAAQPGPTFLPSIASKSFDL